MRVYLNVHLLQKEWGMWSKMSIYLQFWNENNEVIQSHRLVPDRFLEEGERREVFIDAIIPKEYSYFKLYIDNSGSDKIKYIDDLKVTVFDVE